ncbi:Peptide methionine sulfoxide reductase MsrA [Vibrio aerogenes CECT 7868]|uniref:Peptide methionine sulfoxide reductase MsrA n=1 Tax=Vibrio aerogenes CECT 7868 TaxID=1216006 RepID=A0A1M5XK29_9VIBR|nr:peptide-methionine (S)-S-oxide reductase MsrA [Vibrio aerogenes]SHI00109.1 Peptide methionine sulfoxide reductase MsrA [Vibrio aerogenes CECT 7868]
MSDKRTMIAQNEALKGRAIPFDVEDSHFVNHSSIHAEPTKGQAKILLGMGCFWGAEKMFWQLDGVISTSVGYSGGYTPNPTYEEVCTGKTGHTEVVRIIYQPEVISLETLLTSFWENHDPTQGMQQGPDMGTQYRSAIYFYHDEQRVIAERTRQRYQEALTTGNQGMITTEITPAGPYYFAETYHQQYLAKNPDGYCGLNGTGVCFAPPQ